MEVNKQIIDFLDVTFNLQDRTFQPYVKPNNVTKYININSNHPPICIKNIPEGINKRLNSISSNENLFNKNAKYYQDELVRKNLVGSLLFARTMFIIQV